MAAQLPASSAADAGAAEEAYQIWRDQFPLAAARRDYYGVPCGPADVQARFLGLAGQLGLPAAEALEMFRKDMWVLGEPEEKLPEKLEALRSLAASEEKVLDFLRAAPRAIATTSAKEMRQRGLDNMRLRASVGDIYETITMPLRLVVMQSTRSAAAEIEEQVASAGASTEAAVANSAKKREGTFEVLTVLLFGGLAGSLVWLTYMDATYGGPIHAKGVCIPASIIPSYNIPDDEGNARLPCTCAPVYKWYIEPQLTVEQKEDMLNSRPQVGSKNCGKLIGGEKKACDPRTVGACVWTTEDLAKDPETWDRREPTFWERERLKLESSGGT
mmetsp:Transcript_165387/g.525573  ORF Transcript_165387/g.525573 Transcript_165387/m.525573 type:complete len:330 (-) Transcript_165387:94-1083(-)